MKKCFLIKYKNKEGNIMTLITKESEGVDIRSLIYDMKGALQKTNATEYPTFAIEEIPEERFCYFKRKGYYSLGE